MLTSSDNPMLTSSPHNPMLTSSHYPMLASSHYPARRYLFELLQNAVDDGASGVSFRLREGGAPALLFAHNGREFTPLDVLGLVS
jgi:hypothetical protein